MTACDQPLIQLLERILEIRAISRDDEAELFTLMHADEYSQEALDLVNAVMEGLANGSVISVP